jgi:hypothetical protein
MTALHLATGKHIVVGVNDDSLKLFRIHNQ